MQLYCFSHWSVLSKYLSTNLVENVCKCSTSYFKVRIPQFTCTKKGCFEWGCIHTSLKRGGFKQPRIACSRPYCRRFNACKSSARDDLVSSLNCDRRFRFFKAASHTIAFCTRESAIFFLNSPPGSGAEARLKSYVNRCHIGTGTHKFKSAVLVSGVLFQKKKTLKKLEHILPCKSSGPCPKLLLRVPKIQNDIVLPFDLL